MALLQKKRDDNCLRPFQWFCCEEGDDNNAIAFFYGGGAMKKVMATSCHRLFSFFLVLLV